MTSPSLAVNIILESKLEQLGQVIADTKVSLYLTLLEIH